MHPSLSSFPSSTGRCQASKRIAKQYEDEGYDVIVKPQGDQIPAFLVGFELDMIATRGRENVVVEIKTNRSDFSNDPFAIKLAEIVNAQPGWTLDLVVLEEETPIEKAAQEAKEPSDEQLAQILKTADDLTDKGHASYACLIAWSGMEAVMRRIRNQAELYGKTTPNELMRTLYGNGFLSREQFDRLKESYKIRTQVAHGLVPSTVEPGLIHYVAATARALANREESAVSP